MGKRTLLTGIIVGASIGGLISLLDEDAREYAKQSLSQSREALLDCAKNPTEAVNKARNSVQSINNLIADNANNAVNALEQVESSLDKVLKK